MPILLCSRLSSPRMSSRSCASRFESGSSSRSSRGSCTIARASATRCCWPPESRVAGPLLEAVEIDDRERALDAVRDLGARIAPVLGDRERERHVLGHRHVRPDRIGLEHHADRALLDRHVHARLRVEQRPAVDRDHAVVRRLQPRDAAQRRGLAAAGGAEQREEGARIERKARLADAAGDRVGRVVEDFCQSLDAQHEYPYARPSAPAAERRAST